MECGVASRSGLCIQICWMFIQYHIGHNVVAMITRVKQSCAAVIRYLVDVSAPFQQHFDHITAVKAALIRKTTQRP